MIDLTTPEHDALQRLVRAGAQGLPLSAEVPASAAIRLELCGYVKIQRGQGAAVATSKGAAFSRRQVF